MPKLTDKIESLDEELRKELGEKYKEKLKDKKSKESIDLLKIAKRIKKKARLFKFLYEKGDDE